MASKVDIELVDVFKAYSPFPWNYMPEFYPWLINHSKSSWGMGYKLSNTPQRAKVLSRGMYVTVEGRIKKMLREHPADVVVSRPFAADALAMQALNAAAKPARPSSSSSPIWSRRTCSAYDRRADRTLVPTQPAYERGLEAGLERRSRCGSPGCLCIRASPKGCPIKPRRGRRSAGTRRCRRCCWSAAARAWGRFTRPPARSTAAS